MVESTLRLAQAQLKLLSVTKHRYDLIVWNGDKWGKGQKFEYFIEGHKELAWYPESTNKQF